MCIAGLGSSSMCIASIIVRHGYLATRRGQRAPRRVGARQTASGGCARRVVWRVERSLRRVGKKKQQTTNNTTKNIKSQTGAGRHILSTL